jgi:hypothetical protein
MTWEPGDAQPRGLHDTCETSSGLSGCDSRSVRRPSTAHRADGTVNSKTQRELGPEDLQRALPTYMDTVSANTASLDTGASAALRASESPAVERPVEAKSRRTDGVQADIST